MILFVFLEFFYLDYLAFLVILVFFLLLKVFLFILRVVVIIVGWISFFWTNEYLNIYCYHRYWTNEYLNIFGMIKRSKMNIRITFSRKNQRIFLWMNIFVQNIRIYLNIIIIAQYCFWLFWKFSHFVLFGTHI